MSKCDSDYANLAGYSNGISYVPVKAPTISSIKVNLVPPQQKSGYQSLEKAYLSISINMYESYASML